MTPTTTGDLVLPLVAAVAAVAVTAYASMRRRLRTTTRTTPGGGRGSAVPLDELARRAARSLVGTDDCVRASREELSYVAGQFGYEVLRPYADAVEYAGAELAEAFLLRQRMDDGRGEARPLLADIVARCAAAGRRLDAAAAGFDQVRALERTAPEAVEYAELRFRELAARIADADGTLAGLRERYPLSAYLPVAGHVEQAKDRLVFTTTCLGLARQALDRGEQDTAVAPLRAVEAAVGQAESLLDGVARLASDLTAARSALPAALTDVEAAAARANEQGNTATARADLRGRIAHGESVAAAVRRTCGVGGGKGGEDGGADAGPGSGQGTGVRCDPVGALRRIEEAAAGLDRALGRLPEGTRALGRLQRALLVADGSVRATSDYVTTHRGAVGCQARTRLAEAERRLRAAGSTGRPAGPGDQEDPRDAGGPETPGRPEGVGAPSAGALADAREADALARQARQLAERDVRAFGTPYGEGVWTGSAVLGGILLPSSEGPSPEGPGTAGPAHYGGPATRGRGAGGEPFRPTTPAHRTAPAEPTHPAGPATSATPADPAG
ncbi:TPM domain-containing protein [Streptomyces sp. NPDC048664]|uniref:TPM domain-containing protein n=1 Tax=Streptomyces sp. NPDC048664 TaxID=3154505 RepID=UPI003431EFAC